MLIFFFKKLVWQYKFVDERENEQLCYVQVKLIFTNLTV